MSKFDHMQMISKAHGETNDCVVIAVALAADVSYTHALRVLEAHGRRPRKGIRFHNVYPFVMHELGCKCERDYGLYDWIVKAKGSRFTGKTAPVWLPPKGVFILQFRNHLAAFVHGELMDWTAKRKHPVIGIYQVTRM